MRLVLKHELQVCRNLKGSDRDLFCGTLPNIIYMKGAKRNTENQTRAADNPAEVKRCTLLNHLALLDNM
jgi:hypothetical protein